MFTRREIFIGRTVEVVSTDYYTCWGGGSQEGHHRNIYHSEVGVECGDRAAGFDELVRRTREWWGWGVSIPGSPQTDLINLMAQPAHEAWMRAQQLEGTVSRKAEWGEEFMVPWEELSERGREFDRVIMRAILEAFERNGYVVVKKPEVTT